uniref:Mitochondrial ribosomal protein S35 n=1 Tax=Salmo trutta TaxID=8032 RepID=A0A673X9S0_SALTR
MAAHTMNKSILSFLGQINGCIYGTHALNPLNRDGLSPFCLFPVSMVCVRRVTPGQRMPVDQDWTAVYPTAAPFRQGSVPLPVRMGFPVKRGVPPEKGNLELIKIPYFLHLTPAAIKKHCEPLKHKSTFCTEWPSALDTDAKYDEHFPVKVKSKDYVSAGTSLRNPSARIVHLRVKLSSLNLDDHARKKMGTAKRHTLTIPTDSCPVRRHSYDYAMYLLTVLYHESWGSVDSEWTDGQAAKAITVQSIRDP